MSVGIEALNIYGAPAFIDVKTLFRERGLDLNRSDNLMMVKKAVGIPCEDPVTNAVNAAKPILELLSEDERNQIELLITSTESGLDFGKSLSTYIHDYLNLNKNCSLFEVKQACYAATAAVQVGVNYIASNVSPGGKVLVIGTDTARASVRHTYAEPSTGVGAVAMLLSDNPEIMHIDLGARGYYSCEVMDTCRPLPDLETGDADLSLLSYLDCLENSFKLYSERVADVDFQNTFDYLTFHTPFAGMVKGAHRKMMRQFKTAGIEEIDADFEERVAPSLKYCVEVGNIYSATLYLALCSVIDFAEFDGVKRVGLFSYGSGCSSEFYSGLISNQSKSKLSLFQIQNQLKTRYALDMEEYDNLVDLNMEWLFGIKNKEVEIESFENIYDHYFKGKGLLVLKRVRDFHREYEWS